MKKFIQELKRRNVIKASLAYLVIAWVLLQVLQFLLPMINAPDWALKGITLVMAIGLPIWIIISWIYEITPEGIEKTAKVSENELVTEVTNKRLNVFIIVSLSIAVIFMGLKLSNFFSDSDEQKRIAILPFDSMIVDDDKKWLSAGFTLDVNTYLSKMKKLHVTSSKSTMKYKDSDKTNPEIAEELVVSYILRGTVRQIKSKVIITVSLIDVNTDDIMWSENYEEELDEHIFKIQKEVSKKIVAELKIKLNPEEEKTLEKFPTENMEAYKLYVEGQLINDIRKKEDLEKNIELNKQAIALDPNFAEAYAEIGQSTFLLGFYYSDYDYNWGIKNGMTYLEKALQIDPNTAKAYAGKGMIARQENNWKAAQGYFKKAIELSPSDATIRYQYAANSSSFDYNEHLIQIAKAQQLDPLSALIGHQYFASLINNDKIREAEKYFSKYRFLFTKPGEQLEKESVIIAYKNKDWTTAVRFFEDTLKKDPDNAILNRKLGEAYDGILLDNSNYIKYTKKAYELDSTNWANGWEYQNALLVGKKFAAYKKLIQSQNFKSVYSKSEGLNYLFNYYYFQENYKKAQDLLKDSLMYAKDYNKAAISAQFGERNAVVSYLESRLS
jgi:TolB-like protein